MARWKLRDDVGYVEAYKNKNMDPLDPEPGQDNHPAKEARLVLEGQADGDQILHFGREAAFAARFIVQGVDTDLVKQILLSEFRDLDPQEAENLVTYVCGQLQPYLVPATRKEFQGRLDVRPKACKKQFDLNFKVNWLGNIIFKG